MFEQLEEQVRSYVESLRLLVEARGALVIAAGVLLVLISLARHVLSGHGGSFMRSACPSHAT